MNYRHAFHAGSFADVVKHAVLVRMLLHLRAKPAPFRVIDTHAGGGLYDLTGPEATRGGEWRDGIARLLAAPLAADARALVAPYLDAVQALDGEAGGERDSRARLTRYPGSPVLARAFLRAQDRLTACELEPDAAAALARTLHGDRRCKALAIDGWTALNAYVPPKERRGLVLVDPPFEAADDFTHLAEALAAAHRKWASGSYLAWYPIKERAGPDALARSLRRAGIAKVLRAELGVGRSPADPDPEKLRAAARLAACGLIVINPPWTLADELAILLPALAGALSEAGQGSHRVDMIAGERVFRHFSTALD
jgi:23S rRNA (adenine2030-N6)-methyltransferase